MHDVVYFAIFVSLILPQYALQIGELSTSPAVKIAQERSEHLLAFAKERKRPRPCGKSVWYLSSRNPYGRTGNRWMQFGNLLW